ncbi:MAG: hypothetical protein RQ966_15085 [Acetobacteraceae bacterium]|nr:hypothetical protein [Acetobacteraceae bacterium]
MSDTQPPAFLFSPSKIAFYPMAMRAAYEASNTWPADGVPATDAMWRQFIAPPPSGKVLGAANGQPAWIDAPPPAAPTVIPSSIYLARFSTTETSAIHAFALTSPPTTNSLQVFNFLLLAAASPTIDLSNAVVTGGHAALVGLGLLTADRSAAILAPRTDGT